MTTGRARSRAFMACIGVGAFLLGACGNSGEPSARGLDDATQVPTASPSSAPSEMVAAVSDVVSTMPQAPASPSVQATERAAGKLAAGLPLANITPVTQTITGTQGREIEPSAPLSVDGATGQPITFTLVDCPGLPQGLRFDDRTGILSGRPATPADVTCIITIESGRNAGAKASVHVVIAKSESAPQQVRVTASQQVLELTTGEYSPLLVRFDAIGDPPIRDGVRFEWSISPSLPRDLKFGLRSMASPYPRKSQLAYNIVYGRAETAMPAKTYRVTAQLATGESGSVDVTISVRQAAPRIVSIEPNAVTVVQPNWKGIPMVRLRAKDFTPNAWGWTPDLPKGITASGWYGGEMLIQGRAEDLRLAGSHTYTLTATDSRDGTASATLTIVFEQ